MSTYWESRGKYQHAADELQKLVPTEGKVTAPNSRALEKFRKASNCYYDLFNNHLANRMSEFTEVFGFSMRPYFVKSYKLVSPCSPRTCISKSIDFDRLGSRLEDKMNEIIIAAAKEQMIAFALWGNTND